MFRKILSQKQNTNQPTNQTQKPKQQQKTQNKNKKIQRPAPNDKNSVVSSDLLHVWS